MLEITTILKGGDPKVIAQYMKDNDLTIEDGKIVPIMEKAAWVKGQVGFWDQRQQARKILLNSLYGALLNEALRFSDERMGQSVTLTGRSIVRHMNAQVNMELTGEYDYLGKAICYADTDSCYFSAAFMMNEAATREDYIKIYDMVADAVNSTFPEFMQKSFNTSLKRGAIIAAGRELVASKMLFIKKKKYGGIIYDHEGTRLDTDNQPGKLKAMGLDLKRADTPKFMQTFLERILMDVLTGATSKEIIDQIKDFRIAFKDRPAWEKGSPKKVSNLTKYRAMMERAASMGVTEHRKKGEKAKNTIPGHVRASVNWNNLLDLHGDRFSMRITDGSRIIVCKLLPNLMKMDSVAYPVDEPHLPKWFKELPFDHAAMEEVIIDKKVSNLVGVLNWPLGDSKIVSGEEFFDFG
jgi:DNA polymerase elongation subunit (family B)